MSFWSWLGDWAKTVRVKARYLFGVWCLGLLQQIENLTQESRTLAAIRDALLPKLLSGELRVKDAELPAERRA